MKIFSDKVLGKLGEEYLNLEWKTIFIDNKETNYKISNTGIVKNRKDEILLNYITNGYYQIQLSVDGIIYHKSLHRLVAEAFIPNLENKSEVNHIDGNKLNNHYTNLEWVTRQENINHSIIHKLKPIGINCSSSKYTEEQVHQVCKLLEEGKGSTEISKLLRVSKTLAENIKNGSWKHISSQYKIPAPKNISNEELVHQVCKLLEQGKGITETAKILKIPKTLPDRIKNGSWKNISSQYKIPKTKKNKYINDINVIEKICKLLEEGKSNKEISKITNIKYYTIKDIRQHKSWNHISYQYKF